MSSTSVPQFLHRDPNHPEFWDERFETGFTPWNRGAVPQALRSYVQSRAVQTEVGSSAVTNDSHYADKPVCLIPGCGHAYELGFLSENGWDVTAIDFSAAAVSAAKSNFAQWADKILQADFFAYQPKITLTCIYERAFFCALPPAMRTAVVARWADLLPVGAKLFGFFLLDDNDGASKKGPPFRTHPQEWTNLMQTCFVCLEDSEVHDSLPVFEGKERWQVWQRV